MNNVARTHLCSGKRYQRDIQQVNQNQNHLAGRSLKGFPSLSSFLPAEILYQKS